MVDRCLRRDSSRRRHPRVVVVVVVGWNLNIHLRLSSEAGNGPFVPKSLPPFVWSSVRGTVFAWDGSNLNCCSEQPGLEWVDEVLLYLPRKKSFGVKSLSLLDLLVGI